MIDYSKAPNNRNLISYIMKMEEFVDYQRTLSFIDCILYLSPEPRIYQHSVHFKNNNKNTKTISYGKTRS